MTNYIDVFDQAVQPISISGITIGGVVKVSAIDSPVTITSPYVSFIPVTTPISSPDYTNFNDVRNTNFSVNGFVSKVFMIINTGLNGVKVQGLASLDQGITFDWIILPSIILMPQNTLLVREKQSFSNFKFQVKRLFGDSQVETKGYVTGV